LEIEDKSLLTKKKIDLHGLSGARQKGGISVKYCRPPERPPKAKSLAMVEPNTATHLKMGAELVISY